MSISSEEVGRLAQLARLAIDDTHIQSTADSVGDVLEMIDTLKRVDTSAVAPLSHPLDEAQRLRADEVSETNQRDAFQAIAPATEEGLYLVPRVIE